MKNENQNIEYKETWRDEYLKWICGFANAQGGKIYVGVDDDKNVVGVVDAHRLMDVAIRRFVKNSTVWECPCLLSRKWMGACWQ